MASTLSSLICWTPRWCVWDKQNPRPLTIWLIVLYGCAGGFFTANLFYSHPILELLARDFNTDQARVANIPTLATAGDATGLILIMPLADFFPRRKFSLVLMSCTVLMWLGLCLSRSLVAFEVLTYLSALTTGMPQIMIPLVSQYSTSEKRAFNLSIVSAGPTLAILIARILSGIVANFVAWRNVYWLALALQATTLICVYLFMPDYPAINPLPVRQILRRYHTILWSIVQLYAHHPVLVQCCLLAFCTFFCVSSYWTTLTFLLADPPYDYSTLVIGLFGLVAVATFFAGPLYARYLLNPVGQPLYSVLVATTISLVGIIIGTFVGKNNVAGPIIQAVLLDTGLVIEQLANRMSLHHVAQDKMNRVNTAFISSLYLGLLAGTKASNQVYQQYGGWVASGALNIGVMAMCYVFVLVRGPNTNRWVGWKGGWKIREEGEKVKEQGNVEAGQTAGQEKPSVVEQVNVMDVMPAETGDEKMHGHDAQLRDS